MQPNEKMGKRLDYLIECHTVEEANEVDRSKYRLSERISESRRSYVFILRKDYV